MKTDLSFIEKPLWILFITVTVFSSCIADKTIEIEINNLRCELIDNPVGIDIAVPRLSWELDSKERSVIQLSYRILVSSSLEKLNANEGDLWDSRTVKSDESVFIPYGGEILKSRMECYWKVCVNTNKGKSEWSKPAKWTMGLLTPQEWDAKWIGLDQSFEWEDPTADNTRLAARYFRKEFTALQQPEKATLYLCGLGLYKLYINGEMIGEQELSPTPTDYRKEVKYNTFDITETLNKEENASGIMLGNGRCFQMRPAAAAAAR